MARPTRRRLAAALLFSSAVAPTLATAQPAPDTGQPAGPTSSSRPIAPSSRSSARQRHLGHHRRGGREGERQGRRRPSAPRPGVTLTQSGGPGHVQTVRIRGGDVRHTLVMIDGIRVNDPSSTGREFDFSNLVLTDVERIEVLRGPQSALYGSEALGGVINIITKRGASGPSHGNVSVETGRYGTKEVKGAISGGDDKVDYSFGFAGYDTAGFSAFGYRIPRLRYLAPFGFEPDAARRAGVTGRIRVNVADGVRLEVGGGHNFNRAPYDAAFLPFPDTPSHAQSTLSNVYSRLIANCRRPIAQHRHGVGEPHRPRLQRHELRDRLSVLQQRFFPGLRARRLPDSVALHRRPRRGGIPRRAEARAARPLDLRREDERETADSFNQGVVPKPTPLQRTIAAEQTTRSVFALHQLTPSSACTSRSGAASTTSSVPIAAPATRSTRSTASRPGAPPRPTKFRRPARSCARAPARAARRRRCSSSTARNSARRRSNPSIPSASTPASTRRSSTDA